MPAPVGGDIDQDRLPDQRQILRAGAVFIGFADAFRKRRRNTTGEEGGDVELLPWLEVNADHDRDFGIELHELFPTSFRDAPLGAGPE
jgi:hypothetical protein